SKDCMHMRVPLAVTAKNEQESIGPCLTSLLVAAAWAEDRLPIQLDVVVVLDDCTDATADVVRRFPRVRTIVSSGGIVEAQRQVAQEGPFRIYSDADIYVEPETLHGLVRCMLDDKSVQVAYPRKVPMPPRRRT